jgi:hypothetical protein
MAAAMRKNAMYPQAAMSHAERRVPSKLPAQAQAAIPTSMAAMPADATLWTPNRLPSAPAHGEKWALQNVLAAHKITMNYGP